MKRSFSNDEKPDSATKRDELPVVDWAARRLNSLAATAAD
jgi:hypothetical protein